MEGFVNEWNEGGKNRWRYQVGSDEKVIEIELTQGKVALIDAERLEEVLKHRWSAKRNYNTFYAHRAEWHNGIGVKTISMHIHLFPEIVPPRDHIDRNGLNNTRINLRSGANGINRRNSHTVKKDKGIKEEDRAYRATWSDSLGKHHSRVFTWSKYSSPEDAYNAAVACRVENDQKAIREIISAQEQNRPIESTAPVPKPPKTGPHHKNICILYRRGKFYRVKADVRMNGPKTTKYFSAFQYGDDLDLAIAAAEEWVENMKAERNKKRERDD